MNPFFFFSFFCFLGLGVSGICDCWPVGDMDPEG